MFACGSYCYTFIHAVACRIHRHLIYKPGAAFGAVSALGKTGLCAGGRFLGNIKSVFVGAYSGDQIYPNVKCSGVAAIGGGIEIICFSFFQSIFKAG